MKKIILFITACLISSLSWASNGVLNIYNWSGYIPPKVIRLFQKETGIQVNYSTFDSNQILYTKLRASPNSNYDIVVPSSYIVDRMRKQNMLHLLNKSKLPNIKYLKVQLLDQAYDPKNKYSLPYLWGTTGIIVNAKYYPKGTIHTWKDLWNPRFRHQIAMSNSMRDMFAVGLKVSGYSINDHNPKHIYEAYLKLKKLIPNALSFEAEGSQPMYVNEDAKLGIIDSGDAHVIRQENSNFYYVYPKDGVLIWIDNMVIPKNAKHIQNAYRFMNFVMRPDIARMISEGVGYSSPNHAAISLMSKANQENHILNPTASNLKNAETESDIGYAIERLNLKYWELLKLGS